MPKQNKLACLCPSQGRTLPKIQAYLSLQMLDFTENVREKRASLFCSKIDDEKKVSKRRFLEGEMYRLQPRQLMERR
jgi:hypothetical protein